jgi:tetratricopeptide (TPR) repeat protein
VITTPPGPQAVEPAGAGAAWTAMSKEMLRFIQDHPGTPEATLAERSLEQLIEANDDLASLGALREMATDRIALRLQSRIDRLAGHRDVTGALPGKTAETPPKTPPGTQMAMAPNTPAQPAEAVDPAAGVSPRDPKIHVMEGLASMTIGAHDRAIASFDKAILLDPANAQYRLHRAAAWLAKGELDRALTDYNEALSLDENNVAAFRARSKLWLRRSEVEHALADLDQAIRLSFSDPDIYRERGQIWFDKGRYDRAIADFNRAISLAPNSAPAYISRGLAFQRKGDTVTAEINFEKAAMIDPSVTKTYKDLYPKAQKKKAAAEPVP